MGNVQVFPVIQARTLKLGAVNVKAQWSDQMQTRAGCGAGAGNISGVLRDARLHQRDVQAVHGGPLPHYFFFLVSRSAAIATTMTTITTTAMVTTL